MTFYDELYPFKRYRLALAVVEAAQRVAAEDWQDCDAHQARILGELGDAVGEWEAAR